MLLCCFAALLLLLLEAVCLPCMAAAETRRAQRCLRDAARRPATPEGRRRGRGGALCGEGVISRA